MTTKDDTGERRQRGRRETRKEGNQAATHKEGEDEEARRV